MWAAAGALWIVAWAGGLTEGIIYNDAQNLKGDMNVRKGGEVDVCGYNFFECFFTSASLYHPWMSAFVHFRSLIRGSRCMHKMDFKN